MADRREAEQHLLAAGFPPGLAARYAAEHPEPAADRTLADEPADRPLSSPPDTELPLPLSKGKERALASAGTLKSPSFVENAERVAAKPAEREYADPGDLLYRLRHGQLQPLASVDLGAHPAGSVLADVAALAERVFGAADAAGERRPVILPARWVAEQTGRGRTSVAEALRALAASGYLEHDRTLEPTRDGYRGARCYLLGAGARVELVGGASPVGALPDAAGDVEVAAGVRRAELAGEPPVEVVDEALVGDAVGRRAALDLYEFGAAAGGAGGDVGTLRSHGRDDRAWGGAEHPAEALEVVVGHARNDDVTRKPDAPGPQEATR